MKNLFVFLFVLTVILYPFPSYPDSAKVLQGVLNIDTASESDFMMLPGIGKITAHRIIKFRDDNEGFKNLQELTRVEGVSQKMFISFKDHLTLTGKSDLKLLIDINSASKEALLTLPRVSKEKAEAIINYRKKHEGFTRIEDLLLIKEIDKKEYDQIKEFVIIQPLRKKK
ncbi:MAG: helix-hairpin-helix domain-containing protein [Nitrospinae bacterium]|nr:helix-hairpin-helix domain-containing protein [Nitrospinota bacterium]